MTYDEYYNIITHCCCKTQKGLFELVANRPCDFGQFLDAFMNSDLCRRLDSLCSSFQIAFPEEICEEFEREYKFSYQLNYLKVPSRIAGDVGYLYRLVSRKLRISSKVIYDRLRLGDIRRVLGDYDDADYEELARLIIDRYFSDYRSSECSYNMQ